MLAIVNETIVTVKNAPSDDAIRIDEIFLGMAVNILWDDVNNYCYIETEYNYKGYINKKSLIIKKDKVNNWIDNANYMVNGEYVDILDNIPYDSKKIISAMRGSRLAMTGKKSKIRSQVSLPDSRKGWIRNEFLKRIEEPSFRKIEDIRSEIVDNALKYLGKQFRWGGKSPHGLDSSGLTSMVYFLSGLKIWRDSDLLDESLIRIKKAELKHGDLIFGKAHTAIYLGDNKFINASAVDAKVVIKSINENDKEYDDIFSDENTIYACHKLLRG
ncbi:NlpC/P60 family protein [Clostridiaceae bacterium HSG29]|nr:NlpC/P60 family protein [Clostridiaceae bacterium HSG29]